MRNADIKTLEKVMDALENHLPCKEIKLLTDFAELYARLKAVNDREKQNYQNNAEYYRDKVKRWKVANPEKQPQYSKEYALRKKKGKQNIGGSKSE